MEEKKENRKEGEGSWSAFRFAWELGYTIAIPLVLFAVGGALIDRWLNTKPWFLLGGVIVSMFISTLGIYFKAIKIISRDQTQKQNKLDKKEINNK